VDHQQILKKNGRLLITIDFKVHLLIGLRIDFKIQTTQLRYPSIKGTIGLIKNIAHSILTIPFYLVIWDPYQINLIWLT